MAILSSIQLIGSCQWGMRQNAELENQMTSVERIAEYAELPPEPPLESDEKNAPPKDWPQYGNIEFKSLSLRYAENTGRILRNLTFHINSKVKVFFNFHSISFILNPLLSARKKKNEICIIQMLLT